MTDQTPTYDDILGAARQWHYTEVGHLADEAIKECLASDAAPGRERREWLDEWVRETCDQHERVIYTGQASLTCAASDNEDAYQDEFGEPAPTVEARACWALIRDVWQLLDARSDEWEGKSP